MTDRDDTFVVADIGGTTLRIGHVTAGDPVVRGVRRVATDGLARHPGAPVAELQQRVLGQLATELAAYLVRSEAAGSRAVGLSFAGPTTADGVALAAPTIWGEGGGSVALNAHLGARLGVPVLTVNDITAAAWRYARAADDAFCLFTVSSGVGSKVFRRGEVLVDDAGFGGELGHWRVDWSGTAPPCDCGGRGHLGGIASGRGILRAVRVAARQRPGEFGVSRLAASSAGRPEGITNEAVALAVRGGDSFAVDVLRAALRPLALAVASVFSSIGIRRYIFIGGFAVAVGQPFVDILGDELTELGCFGLTPPQVRAMLTLGAADDDHSLIGVGRLLAAAGAESRLAAEAAHAYVDRR
ncbi:ROK family protein [Micromonospora haikouensis]|uniref:ROK family protein n=1 Tax=Micromonospora haikouensis TaxID=686309 RepID=UPI0036B8069A